MEKDIFLKAPIDSMCFSEEFCERCGRMGFLTIGAIIDTPVEDILKNAEFSYKWLEELLDYLHKNQQLPLLQPIPGRSYD